MPLWGGFLAILFLAWWGLGLFGPWVYARHEVLTLAAAGAVLGIGYLIGIRQDAMDVAWAGLNWSLLAFAIIALIDHISVPGQASGRLVGSFGSANTTATLMAIAMLSGTAKVATRLQHPRMAQLSRPDRINYLAQSEYASLGLLIAASLCLLLTISRAGILLGLTCTFILASIEIRRIFKRGRFAFFRRKRVYLPIFAIAGILFLLALTGYINPQAPEDLLHNLGGRFFMFDHYLGIWSERPVFGYGLGSFNRLTDETTTLENASSLARIGAAHNVVLQWLVQQGIAGLAVMSLVLIGLHIPILTALRRPSRLPRHFLRLALFVSLLVLSHGMVDYALEIPSVMWTYALVLGIACGFATRTRLKKD